MSSLSILNNDEILNYQKLYNKNINEEWGVVNEYLNKELHSWCKVVENFSLDFSTKTKNKNLTLAICAGRLFLSLIQKSDLKSVNDYCLDIASNDPDQKFININEGEWSFNLIKENAIYEKEINTFKQPGVPEGTAINNSYDFDDLEQQLKNSLNLISKTSSRIKAVVKNGFSSFIPLKLPKGMDENQCISFTARNAPGAVFISITPMILLAESIVHESVHNIVYNASRLHDFVKKDSSLFVDSPLRNDKRPIYGVFHQAVVLNYLVEFYFNLKSINNHENISRNRDVIIKRESELFNDLIISVNTLKKNIEEMSDEGKKVINQICCDHEID